MVAGLLMAVRIGDLLLKEQRITPDQLQEALACQRRDGGKLGLNLIRLGYVTEDDITSLLSRQYGVPSIALSQFEIDPAVIKLLTAETAQKYQVVPLARAGTTLTIAMTDPTNVFALDDIKFTTGYHVPPGVASESSVLRALERYYANGRPPVHGSVALDVASTIKKTGASLSTARAMAMRCLCPPDSRTPRSPTSAS